MSISTPIRQMPLFLCVACLAGCGLLKPLTPLTLDLNPCGDDATAAVAEPVFLPDPADPTLGLLISDPAMLPTFDEVLAQYACYSQQEGVCLYFQMFSEIGVCNDGAYRFMFIPRGGVLRLYFDPQTQRLVGAHEDDSGVVYVLPPGPRQRPEYYLQRIDYEDPIVTGTLCQEGALAPLG